MPFFTNLSLFLFVFKLVVFRKEDNRFHSIRLSLGCLFKRLLKKVTKFDLQGAQKSFDIIVNFLKLTPCMENKF